jgi:hypothetical protein
MRTDQGARVPGMTKNTRVHFHINDVYVPEPDRVLSELHGRDLICGRIIDLSDRGPEPGVFAVVQVDGLSQPVVVPVARIVEAEELT